jgi:hypothetical protein
MPANIPTPEEIGLAVARNLRPQPKRRNGDPPRTFAGYDASAGNVILATPNGGQFPVEAQGSLSNGSIKVGDPVRDYAGRAVDWRPAAPNGRASEPVISTDDEQEEDDEPEQGSSDLSDDLPDEIGEDDLTEPESPEPPRCQQQVLWYQGSSFSLLTYRRTSVFFTPSCQTGNGDSGPVEQMLQSPVSNLRAELYGAAGSCGGQVGARWLVDTGAGPVTLRDSLLSEGRQSVSVELISLEPQANPWQYVILPAPARATYNNETLQAVNAQGQTIFAIDIENAQYQIRCIEDGGPPP